MNTINGEGESGIFCKLRICRRFGFNNFGAFANRNRN